MMVDESFFKNCEPKNVTNPWPESDDSCRKLMVDHCMKTSQVDTPYRGNSFGTFPGLSINIWKNGSLIKFYAPEGEGASAFCGLKVRPADPTQK